ncbi:MAG: hypothetical protein ABI615_03705, partial [Chthoniobacterales bacterium]
MIFIWLLIALMAALVYVGAQSLPRKAYALKIQKSGSGVEMAFDSINFKKESNVLRIEGHFLKGFSPEEYDVRATIGDGQSSPASGPYYWFMLLPKQGTGQPFILEFDSPPATAPVLFCNLYFVKKVTAEVAFSVSFESPNPARQRPVGLLAHPLPQTQNVGTTAVTLESLETGF